MALNVTRTIPDTLENHNTNESKIHDMYHPLVNDLVWKEEKHPHNHKEIQWKETGQEVTENAII